AELAENLPAYLENVQSFIDEQQFFDIELVDPQVARQLNNLGDLIESYGGEVAGGVAAVGNTVFGALFRVVTITLFAYYMVAEGPQLRRTVLGILPQRRQREVLRVWEIAVDKTGGYVYSRFVLALVAAAFTSSVLRLLDVPFSLALGMWVGVLSQFVPVVGTYIAAVLPVLVALFESPATAAWVLLALVAYQQVENFLVAPRITAKAMAIHPAVSVGSVIAGASMLGGIGAVLALPVAATIQAFISTAIERHDLIESAALVEQDRPRRSGKQPGDEPVDPV
ncbi:MAG: AI-2E family transporter, partial [Acidimicrobiia bacterium]|nr:AI-2E family transporter [Acidimicrobiia bacterium]